MANDDEHHPSRTHPLRPRRKGASIAKDKQPNRKPRKVQGKPQKPRPDEGKAVTRANARQEERNPIDSSEGDVHNIMSQLDEAAQRKLQSMLKRRRRGNGSSYAVRGQSKEEHVATMNKKKRGNGNGEQEPEESDDDVLDLIEEDDTNELVGSNDADDADRCEVSDDIDPGDDHGNQSDLLREGINQVGGVSDEEREVGLPIGISTPECLGARPASVGPSSQSDIALSELPIGTGCRTGTATGRDTADRLYSTGTDVSCLLTFMNKMKEDIRSEINMSHETLLSGIRKEAAHVQKIREDVDNVTSIVSTIATVVCNKNGVPVPKHKDVQRLLCTLTCIFNDRVMTNVMCKCFTGFGTGELAENGVDSGTGICLLKIIIFAKNPTETKKEKFSTDLGMKYSKFRHGILLSSIRAMQKNSFQTFLTKREQQLIHLSSSPGDVACENNSEATKDSSTTSILAPKGDIFGSKIVQPSWLAGGYITVEHCGEAAMKAESRRVDDMTNSSTLYAHTESENVSENQSSVLSEEHARKGVASSRQKVQKSTTITPYMISCEAAGMVYKVITNILHRGRDACKIQLFHELLYPFSSWSQFNAPVSQTSLRLEWQAAEPRIAEMSANSPTMEEVRPLDRFQNNQLTLNETDRNNLGSMERFLRKHQGMNLVVEHNVKVSGETRNLRTSFNLIAVAAELITSFCTLENNSKPEAVLGYHRDSLKVIVTVSFALRRLLSPCVDDANSGRTVPWAEGVRLKNKRGRKKKVCSATTIAACTENSDVGGYSFPLVDGLSIEEFLPPPSKQKDVLGPMLLTLREEEFLSKNTIGTRGLETRAGGQEGDTSGSGKVPNGVQRASPITVDENRCVYDF